MASLGPLVVGAGRGGTSLLAALLDAHPLLEMGMEAHAGRLAPARRASGRLVGTQRGSGPVAARAAPSERARLFHESCRASAARSVALWWGNKITTEQIQGLTVGTTLEPLGCFSETMGDVPTITLVRDGRSCLRSKVRRTGMPYRTAAAHWRFSVAAHRHFESLGALALEFEQLVTQPERTLRAVCDFLSIPFDPAMYGGTTSTLLRADYRRDRIDATRAVAPDLPKPVVDLICDDLRACGYL